MNKTSKISKHLYGSIDYKPNDFILNSHIVHSN